MKINWKKTKFYLQHLDWIWSIPLGTGMILFLWYGPVWVQKIGTFSPAYILPIPIVLVILISFFALVMGCLRFNFKGLYDYYIGRCIDGKWENKSKEDFNELKPWQRIFILLFVLFSLFLAAMHIWHSIAAPVATVQ